jgi:hypothetical protein
MHVEPQVVGLLVIALFAWWVVRRLLPLESRPSMPTLQAPIATLAPGPAGVARHPRVELEFHAHRHWGPKRIAFLNGSGRGIAWHLGFGATCLCVDFYKQGRRP